MAGWRLFKRRPEQRETIETSDDLLRLLQKLPTTPSPSASSGGNTPQTSAQRQQRRSASIHSHRSHRSARSSRSSRSNRSNSRQRPKSAQVLRRRSSRSSMPNGYIDRRCFVCARNFNGCHCSNCDTTYDQLLAVEAQPLDISLLFELAANNDHELMESLIVETFNSVDATVETFEHENGGIDVERINLFYEILATPSSTSPMRAVFQGAQSAMLQRSYRPVTDKELFYLLIVMRSPAFTQCSMFTKITGPLQKLARFSSLRSRARVILELSMGLLSNLSPELRAYTCSNLSEMDRSNFESLVDLLNSYIGHRLVFHFHYKSSQQQSVKARNEIKVHWYADDWRIAAAAKSLKIFFEASNLVNKLPVSHFYNMVVDHIELGRDFDAWQANCKRREKLHIHSLADLWNSDPILLNRFSFCEYPFLLTITSKSIVFRHSLQRKVREHQLTSSWAPTVSAMAAGSSISSGPRSGASSQYSVPYSRATNAANSAVHAAWALTSQPTNAKFNLHLLIRREHLFEDSKALLLNYPANDIKKPLRIEFEGEPGIDAGGLCKEWVHLLFTELTGPELGLFVQDEESVYNWFGTHSLDDYTLLGIALGLAFNNGLMIDSGLPDLAYKLLLDSPYSMDDVAAVWPAVTRSLNAILDYEEDDLQEVFGLYFTAPDGTPLCTDGENVAVNLENRDKFVEESIKYMTRNTEQFASFKAGFMRVCDTPALYLFDASEVESLLRGERKPIDLVALRNNTRYIHWGTARDIAKEPVLIWFWDFFSGLTPDQQALLLVFITATPRIPATGISTMQFRISCLGPDSNRLPVAHTCFNQLGLYRYQSRAKLYAKLTMAMTECQSFGIK